MKGRLLDPQATLYARPDTASEAVAQLTEGQELTITGTASGGGQGWAAAVLPDARQGYLPSGTNIYRYRTLRLFQDTDLRAEPSSASPAVGHGAAGEELLVVGEADRDGWRWLKVRAGAGTEGFVPATAGTSTAAEEPDRPSYAGAPAQDPYAAQAAVAAARGRRNMVVGGLWCGGGTVVTVVTYSAASGGGSYVVAWGAILFGGFQFLKGLFQYLNAND